MIIIQYPPNKIILPISKIDLTMLTLSGNRMLTRVTITLPVWQENCESWEDFLQTLIESRFNRTMNRQYSSLLMKTILKYLILHYTKSTNIALACKVKCPTLSFLAQFIERDRGWYRDTDLLYMRISGFQSCAGGILISLIDPYSLEFHRMLASVHSCSQYQILNILENAATQRKEEKSPIFQYLCNLHVFEVQNWLFIVLLNYSWPRDTVYKSYQIEPHICSENLILLILK